MMIGGEILRTISENCFWTKIFQYQSTEAFLTLWGCSKKQWAVLFKNYNDSTYRLLTSLGEIEANFENNRDIHLNQVAKNLYVVNLKFDRIVPTQHNINLFRDCDTINNLDKLFICPIVSSKNINIEPVFNKDYFIYKPSNVPLPTSGLFIYEYLRQFLVVININKYTCPKETTRFKAIVFNLNSGKFTIEIIKTKHNPTHCFYCNIVNKIKLSQHNDIFVFHPRYTQAILNF